MCGAVPVGSQNPHTRILQSFEELLAGMPVRIVFSRGDNPRSRLHRCEKIRHCGILAPVMADLQHICVQCVRAVLRENLAFRLLLRIARQQQAVISVVQPKHQRVIVLRHRRDLLRAGLWPQEVSFYADLENAFPRSSCSTRIFRSRASSSSFARAGEDTSRPSPQLSNSKALQNCRKSPHGTLLNLTSVSI